MKLKVLYIDDEDLNLTLFNLMFKEHFIVIVAKSGQEGLDILIQNGDIQAVVTDMNMPSMNGLEFIEKAKQIIPNIPYIILTGYSRNEELQHAAESGTITCLMEKPFNESLIVNTLQELVG